MSEKQEPLQTVLIVDDIPQNVDLLEAILSHEYTIKTASRGVDALEIARTAKPDLIMLDIMMPEMNGYEVCRALKADAATRNIPVIFVTSLLKPGNETLGFDLGGVDYITKPVISAIVRSRVRTHLALRKAQDELEERNRELEFHRVKLEAQNGKLRRIQEELELSRNTYTALYDFAPVGYFTLDASGQIQEANLAGAQLLGIERQLLTGKPFIMFIADADGRETFLRHLATVLQGEGMQKCEIRITGTEGVVIHGQLQSVAVETIESREGYILTSIVDGTAARQFETEIQDAREYAENIVETVRKPLMVLNSSLMILTANQSFYNTFNVTPEETIGSFIYDIGNRQWDIPQLRVLFEDILPHNSVFNDYEVDHVFNDIGRKIILLNARQIFRKDNDSHIILLAMEDITERKQLEDRLL